MIWLIILIIAGALHIKLGALSILVTVLAVSLQNILNRILYHSVLSPYSSLTAVQDVYFLHS
ncbi:MAG: hypothetical protein ACOYL3_07295 [Desulfuromonadaceae bacterium]